MKIEGVSGEVRVAGRHVVSLGSWKMLTNDEAGEHSIQAKTTDEPDPFWLDSDGPFELRLDFRDVIWCWREADIMWTNEGCWATCKGPQERL